MSSSRTLNLHNDFDTLTKTKNCDHLHIVGFRGWTILLLICEALNNYKEL